MTNLVELITDAARRSTSDRPGGESAAESLETVDVAIVMESTYPYLRGGVSAVVHDIILGNPDHTFGIIHITWDRNSPQQAAYDVPANVKWVWPVYQSMSEHTEHLYQSPGEALDMSVGALRELARTVFDALDGVQAGDMSRLWQLYDDTMNPRTRTCVLWPLLGTKEFMQEALIRLRSADLPLTRMFWLLREFFSLACAVGNQIHPSAAVYHSHTTGMAGLLAAVAARQNDGRVLLTEHNLYTRDTINTMLKRSMARRVTATDWRTDTEVTPEERGWMAWFIEMGRVIYDAADQITYLYPEAIPEARALGAAPEKSCVVPNGMHVSSFDKPYARLIERRERTRPADEAPPRWRLAYCARLVPIKGLSDLLTSLATLVERGRVDFTLDVLGHADEVPEYAEECYGKCRDLNLSGFVNFLGNQNMREVLGEYDLLVLPSHNEGQPMVVLEFMTVGLPVVGTRVGGMQQLVADPLTHPAGAIGPAGLLVPPHDSAAMSDALEAVLSDIGLYEQYAGNARSRVTGFFQLDRAMRMYGDIYARLADFDAVEGRIPPQLIKSRRAGYFTSSVYQASNHTRRGKT